MPVPVVLIVEDSAELRYVLRDALAAEGYQVHTVRDAVEATEFLRTNRIDLLISDVGPALPQSNLDALRQEFPSLPVVALADPSGGDSLMAFAESQRPKQFRSLSKPFRLGDLLSASRDVLRAAS